MSIDATLNTVDTVNTRYDKYAENTGTESGDILGILEILEMLGIELLGKFSGAWGQYRDTYPIGYGW